MMPLKKLSLKQRSKVSSLQAQVDSFSFEAIGTHWQIDLITHFSELQLNEVMKKVHLRIEAFDHVYSRFRDDSDVMEMSRKSGVFPLPDDAERLFALYEKLYRVTNGKVTPLIGQVLIDAGYDQDYSLETKDIQPIKKWEDVFSFSKGSIEMFQSAVLDFGSAGKGYLIDLVGELLEAEGIDTFCVDAGGDILHKSGETKGAKKELLRVGLENPLDISQAVGVAEIWNQSICGSAGNRRTWGNFHHVIDPDTLTSPKHITACWVVADHARVADGLATALFFTDPEMLSKEFEFEYAILDKDMRLEKSTAFPAEFFLG